MAILDWWSFSFTIFWRSCNLLRSIVQIVYRGHNKSLLDKYSLQNVSKSKLIFLWRSFKWIGRNMSIFVAKYLKVIEYKLFPSIFPHVRFMFYCILWLYLHGDVHFSHFSSSSLLFVFLLRSTLFCFIYAHLGPFPIHTFYIRQTTQHKLHSTHML